MDDCSLKKLQVVPAQLNPKFQSDILEYNSIVASNVVEVKFNCVTSDSGASYQICGAQGEKNSETKRGGNK